MQFPIVNMNGTAPSDLLEGYLDASRHLRRAIEQVQKIWPHGRDYQTLPDGEREYALRTAIGEHSERLLKLRQVLVELETLAEHVV